MTPEQIMSIIALYKEDLISKHEVRDILRENEVIRKGVMAKCKKHGKTNCSKCK